MAIKTGRAEGTAEVKIDYTRCTICGLCINVCKGGPLYLDNGKVLIDQTRGFGCIGCGHCVVICPQDCITVSGRDLVPEDIITLPVKSARANYPQLQSLLLSRRSIRNYLPKEVEPEVIQKIIDAVTTAPIGIPPSDVEILVFNSREKVQSFAKDMIDQLKKSKGMFSPAMLYLWRPLIGKAGYEMFKTFLIPLIDTLIKNYDDGTDMLFYNAPLGMYFHTAATSDPGDAIIAATYAVIAAESLGLGSCMIGTVAPFMKRSKPLKQKYGIPLKSRQGIMVIFGYPALRFNKALTRRLAKVKFV